MRVLMTIYDRLDFLFGGGGGKGGAISCLIVIYGFYFRFKFLPMTLILNLVERNE